MNDTQIKTLEQVRQFLEGTAHVELSIDSKEDRYAWIQTTLVRFHYLQLSKADKGGVHQIESRFARLRKEKREAWSRSN